MARARHISTARASVLVPPGLARADADRRRRHRDACESSTHAFGDGVADARSNGAAGQPSGGAGADGDADERRRRVHADTRGELAITFFRGRAPVRAVLAVTTAVDAADLRGCPGRMGGSVS